MIAPDTKNWTWVLDRACPDCGFDASATPALRVASLVRANCDDWQRLFAAGAIRAGRPNESMWSSLEYACHVRDVYHRFETRVSVMLAEDDPIFDNWDQDETQVADRYEDQDPATVIAELGVAAEAIVALLDTIQGDQWERPGRRSDGASFTVDTVTRYMVHDTIHHIWDVQQFS